MRASRKLLKSLSLDSLRSGPFRGPVIVSDIKELAKTAGWANHEALHEERGECRVTKQNHLTFS